MAYGEDVRKKLYSEVVETVTYQRKAEKLLTTEEQSSLITMLATDPECGVLVKGTGGVRKVRFATGGRGKSGSVRVVYFFHDLQMPLFLLTVFAKNKKANLSQAERNALKKLTANLVREFGGKPHDV